MALPFWGWCFTSLPGLFLLITLTEPVLWVCERLGCISQCGGTACQCDDGFPAWNSIGSPGLSLTPAPTCHLLSEPSLCSPHWLPSPSQGPVGTHKLWEAMPEHPGV